MCLTAEPVAEFVDISNNMIENMLGFYVFAIGAIIGSFLNVLIYRLPRNENFVTGRSHCPRCNALIHWYDNIPLISFLLLRGKCRHCCGRISFRYFAVEFITAAFFFICYFIYGIQAQTAVACLLFALLLVVTFIDFRHFIIPDKITLPGMVLGVALSFVNPMVKPLDSLLGLLAGGAALYLLAIAGDYFFKKESLGGGDIKLAAMLGAFLGWQNIIIIFFGSAVLGLIYALIQMALSRSAPESRKIPFGPFLSLAGMIAFFAGDTLIRFYIENFLRIR